MVFDQAVQIKLAAAKNEITELNANFAFISLFYNKIEIFINGNVVRELLETAEAFKEKYHDESMGDCQLIVIHDYVASNIEQDNVNHVNFELKPVH